MKMVEYPVVARRCVRESTYAKYSAIYVKQPFKPNFVVKKAAFEDTLRGGRRRGSLEWA